MTTTKSTNVQTLANHIAVTLAANGYAWCFETHIDRTAIEYAAAELISDDLDYTEHAPELTPGELYRRCDHARWYAHICPYSASEIAAH